MEDKFHLGIKALIRNKDGKIMLLKVNPKSLKGFIGEPYWDIPGGRIQKGETVDETLKREIEEETGIKNIVNSEPFEMVLTKLRIPLEADDVGLILSIYVCEVEISENIKLSDEHIEHKWFTPSEASELLKIKYPKEFTEKIKSLK